MDEILNLEVSKNSSFEWMAYRQQRTIVQEAPSQKPMDPGVIRLVSPDLPLGPQWNPLTGKFQA